VYGRSGFRLTSVLLAVFLATNLLGFAGIMLQAWLPSLTRQTIPAGRLGRFGEIPIGQVKHALVRWSEEADRLIGEIDAANVPKAAQILGPGIMPLLVELPVWRPSKVLVWRRVEKALCDLRGPAEQHGVLRELNRLKEIVDDRRRLRKQELYHGALHAWLFMHIGLAACSLLLALPHVVLSLYF
jgi:hypothetical protein